MAAPIVRRNCVGVDVGGTWVRVAARRGQGRVTTIVTPADRDLTRLAPLLRAIWQRRRWRRRDIAALVVASRALWTRPERRALARCSRPRRPRARPPRRPRRARYYRHGPGAACRLRQRRRARLGSQGPDPPELGRERP